MNPYFVVKLVSVLIKDVQLKVHPLVIRLLMKANGVTFGRNLKGHGIPRIEVRRSGKCTIGDDLIIYSYGYSGLTGENRPSKLIVSENAELIIGNNVGMSSTSIVCRNSITIGDDVKIGGGVMIMDTDFHSLVPEIRCTESDKDHAKVASVAIGKNVFIGAASIVLKGVRIGENSVVGAGSVVSKSIPANEIWAGNPARCIRKLHNE